MKESMLVRSLLAVVVLVSGASAALAQTQTPTPAQLEIFRQLPPEQQSRILQQYREMDGGSPLGRSRDPRDRDLRDSRDFRLFDDDYDRGQRDRKPEPVIDPVTGLPFFGYDLFAGSRSTFQPVVDIPVPVDYVLGPGDVLQVQMLGRTPGTHYLVVNRDGAVNFPELGPITVAGLSFDDARRLLQERVSQQMIGVTLSITMGELRSIRIFVLGEAERPGSYTVSSLSTIANALFVSGGIKPIGSLRTIQLKRNGQVAATLDLYDLLLRGDTRNDLRLSQGDVVFIPPVGPQVGVDGEVRRPGIYELRGEATAGDLVQLGGGLSATAFPQRASLARISADHERTVEDIDLRSAAGLGTRVRSGDLLEVPGVLERIDNAVTLAGHVFRPRSLQHRPGMRISDILPTLAELRPLADANYVLIRRELPPSREVVALSADLAQALRARGSEADVLLEPGDTVTVFSLVPLPEEVDEEELVGPYFEGGAWSGDPRDMPRMSPAEQEWFAAQQAGRTQQGPLPPQSGMQGSTARQERAPGMDGPWAWESEAQRKRRMEARERAEERERALKADRRTIIDELLTDLMLQASFDDEAPVVRVGGRVRAPGLYPLEPGMRISDLLRAGGRLSEGAYVLDAEVTRYRVVNGEFREAGLINVDLAAIRAGDRDADVLLQSYDFLNVKEVTDWSDQESVTLRGEVRFPGTYPIRKGETLLSVLNRAGGLTERAFPEGAVFTREALKEREREQLERLTRQMEADLAALALPGSQMPAGQDPMQAMAAARAILQDLREVEPVGRLAMDLRRTLRASPGSQDDPALQDGDVLSVPGPTQTVTVIGEVHSTTSHLFDRALGRDDYVMLSGGFTQRADRSRVYVIKANGQVSAASSSRWFRNSDLQIAPGDTIVVPMDVERIRPIPLWTAVTQIIFNLAVAVAAVNSF
jgi:polysaccharide biosynthesis/export protein